ncbi:MAG: ParA family protein [Solirubrobacterales bacterium]
MAETIAILSQKGGTGKTTVTRSLAEGLGLAGLDVLTVDADPQGNLSEYYGIPADAFPTLGEVLTGTESALGAIHSGVIPANLGLAEAELILAGRMGRELTMRNALRDIAPDYDVILIDCPPTLGLLTVNALVAADHAILSTEAEHFSQQGAEQAVEVIGLARENLNPELRVLGVLLNIADMRTKHARQTLEGLRQQYGELVFETVIRRSIAYPESARAAKTIFEFDRKRSIDYARLTEEVLGRLGQEEARTRALATIASLEPRAARPANRNEGKRKRVSPMEGKGRPATGRSEWAWVEADDRASPAGPRHSGPVR